MKKHQTKNLYFSLYMIFGFIMWTALIKYCDVKAIGPMNSRVGFATLNQLVHNITGVNMSLYVITDWLGLVPIIFAFSFAILGLAQWLKRKHIKLVDYNILVLGGFYIIVVAIYILFENVIINYRPTLIEGYLEVSYPSSTTLLVMCVMPTAIMQFNTLIKNKTLRNTINITITIFIIFMVISRLISGVHWITDIIGGLLISAGLVAMYKFIADLKAN